MVVVTVMDFSHRVIYLVYPVTVLFNVRALGLL